MNKKRKAIIDGEEISKVYTMKLGGFDQKVLIEGKKLSNPVVIILHGGPGSPLPFGVGCRGLYPDITDNITAVYWDQYGCGINNMKMDSSFKIDTYVDMTIDLINNVKKELNTDNVNLMGISFGTLLAAKVLEKEPFAVKKVFCYGQILKNLTFNDEVYKTLLNSCMPQKDKSRIALLQSQTSEKNEKSFLYISKLINKYTDGYSCKKGEKMPVGKMALGALNSPDYKLKDFLAMINNEAMKNITLIMEIVEQDLSKVISNVKIPYFIMQGECDIVTSTKTIKEFVDKSENPNLKIKILKNCGHMPGGSGMKETIDTFISYFNESQDKVL